MASDLYSTFNFPGIDLIAQWSDLPWCIGNIVPCHGTARGSTPRGRDSFSTLLFPPKTFLFISTPCTHLCSFFWTWLGVEMIGWQLGHAISRCDPSAYQVGLVRNIRRRQTKTARIDELKWSGDKPSLVILVCIPSRKRYVGVISISFFPYFVS